MKKGKNIIISMEKKKFNKIINDSRIYYFDYLRIICSFLVILIHVSSQYYYRFDINSYEFKIAYYYNGFSRFSVPNFFMISGALFLNKDLSFKIIFNKYIKRIIIHILLWSIIYAFININLKELNIKKKFFEIINGPYHLWYLYATIGLYILIPFTRRICQNKDLLKSFINFNFIILFIIPNYIYIISYYSIEISNILNVINSKLNFYILSVNNFYFIFGYYLHMKNAINKEFKITIYILGLISIIFSTKISYDFAFIKKKKIIHFSHTFFNIFFTSISIFIFFKNYFNKLKTNNIIDIIIQYISQLTFGIYLIHPLIIQTMKDLNIFYLQINIIFLIPFITLFIFILSLIFIIVLKNIPKIGKLLI